MVRILVSTFIFIVMLSSSAQAQVFFPFKGEIDWPQKKLLMTIHPDSPSPISIKIAQVPNQEYQMSATINHWAIPFFDISTVLEGTVKSAQELDSGQVLNGRVWSKYTLINFQPVGEFKGTWHVKADTFIIDDLGIGSFNLKGSIQLVAPFQMDLNIRFSGIDLLDFIAIFTDKMELAGKGDVQGEIRVFGYPGKIYLKGQLRVFDGFIENLEFNSMLFNVEGIYPIIRVEDSNITQTDGLAFNVTGTLDLSDQENFKKQIKAFIQEPLVKENAAGLEWTLKRLRSEGHSGTTELKYMFKKDIPSGSDRRSGSDMLGVERKVEF